jgi:hypothetical protein
MTVALINASPLIFLSKINKQHILQELFTSIITTEQVRKEVLTNIRQLNYKILKEFLEKIVIVEKPTNEVFLKNLLDTSSLHIGEASLLALAKEKYKQSDILILDDKLARKIAKLFNFKVLGTLGILLLAEKKSILTKEECKITIDALVTDFRFRISTETYIQIMKELDKK